MSVLKLSKEEIKRLSPGIQTKYVIAWKDWPLETADVLPKRIEFWKWMCKCLKTKDGEKGPFSHLTDHVHKYDVAGLFEAIINSVDIQNPFVFWESFEKFVFAKPEKGEDIFTYFSRIQKLAKALCIRDPLEVGIQNVSVITDWALQLKLLVSSASFPEYVSYAHKLRTKKPSEWIKLSTEQILDRLKTIHDNDTSWQGVGVSSNYVSAPAKPPRRLLSSVSPHTPTPERKERVNEREDKEKRGRVREREQSTNPGVRFRSTTPQRKPNSGGGDSKTPALPSGCPPGTCFGYFQTGKCQRGNACTFAHNQTQKPQNNKPKNANERPCLKCGGPHARETCSFAGDCSYCHKGGHKAIVCLKKKRDEAKAPRAKGYSLLANEHDDDSPPKIPVASDEFDDEE